MFIKSVFHANLGKISSFGKKILGGGGNRYKSIAQKFLAVGVSFSLAAAMVPLGSRNFVAEAADPPTIKLPLQFFATKDDLIANAETGDIIVALGTATGETDPRLWQLQGASSGAFMVVSSAPLCTLEIHPADYIQPTTTFWGLSIVNELSVADSWFSPAESAVLRRLVRDGSDFGASGGTTGLVSALPKSSDGFAGVLLSCPFGVSWTSDVWARDFGSGASQDGGGPPPPALYGTFSDGSTVDLDGATRGLAGVCALDGSDLLFGAGAGGLRLRLDGASAGSPLAGFGLLVPDESAATFSVCTPAGDPFGLLSSDDAFLHVMFGTNPNADGFANAVYVVSYALSSIADPLKHLDVAALAADNEIDPGSPFTARAWLETPIIGDADPNVDADADGVPTNDKEDIGGTLKYATAPVEINGVAKAGDIWVDPPQKPEPEGPADPVGDGPGDGGELQLPVVLPEDTDDTRGHSDSMLSTTVDGLNIFVEDPTKALPDGVYLDVQLIEPGTDRWNEISANYDGNHEVENVSFFEITLRYIKDDSPVEMPLSSPIRVLMQIPDGWDKTDMEAVLIASGADRQFEESIVTRDGIDYVAFWSDHFSPYALIDKLSDAENANSKFVPTGDQVTYLTISGLGLIMTLALGLMLKTYFGGRKFND